MRADDIIRLGYRLLTGKNTLAKPTQRNRRPLATDLFTPAFIASRDFLNTPEWIQLRYDTIRRYGRKCMACGRTPMDGIRINIDHIISRRARPDLALDPENMQCLCGPCNQGKGNRHFDDWR